MLGLIGHEVATIGTTSHWQAHRQATALNRRGKGK
jgi:hypothetical protein